MPGSRRLALLAVLVVVAAVATSFNGATTHLPALLLRGLVVVGCVLLWPAGPSRLRHRDLAAPAVALVAVAIGLARTTNVGPALQASVTVLLVVALFTASLASDTDHGPALLRAAAAVGVVHAVWAIAERLSGAARASAGFLNPNYLAAFLAPLAVLALGELQTGRDRGRRAVAAVLCALLFAGVLASGSRSALAASVAGMLIALWPTLHRRPWVAAAAALVAGASAVVLASRWVGAGDAYAYARLTHIWPRSALLALESPLGVGLSGYADAMRVFGIPFDGWVRYPRLASNAHSEPLNAWVELGWLGLAATIAAPAAVANSLWLQRSSTVERPWRQHTHWGVLATLAIPGAVSASLHGPPLAFLAAVWAAHVARGDVSPGRTIALGLRRRGVALILAAALLVALSGAVSAAAMDRAVTLREINELGRAVAFAELGEAAAPYSPGAAMLAESLRYLAGGERQRSVETLLELADRYPGSVRPLDRAASLLEEVAETPAAWQVVARLRREAARRDPLAVGQWLALGRALVHAGNPAGARAAVTEALAVEPHCAEAHATLALLATDAADAEAARRHARAALESSAARGVAPGRSARVLFLPPKLERMLRERDLLEP